MRVSPISYNINVLKSSKAQNSNIKNSINNNSIPSFKGTFPQILFTPTSTVVSTSTLVNFVRNPISTSDYEYEICDKAKDEALSVLQESFDLIFDVYKSDEQHIEKEDGKINIYYRFRK